MARSNTAYGMKEFTHAIIAETTAMTLNVTTMRSIPVSGDVTVTENVFRRQDTQAGVGRTAKSVDLAVEPLGSVKTISIPMYLDATLMMYLLENGAGKVEEVATNELKILFNHTPAACGLGGSFTDWTGTMTYAAISPIAAETEVYPGCVVSSITIGATKGTDNGRFNCTVELMTQSAMTPNQATPSALVAYTISDKNIHDFCDTSQVNSVDVQPNSFEVKYAFNPKFVGVCNNGDAYTIAKNVDELAVDTTLVYAYDDNVPEEQKKGRLPATFPIEMSDGSDFFFLSATVNPTADVTKTTVESLAFWTLNAKAFAGTSGNLHEVQLG